MLLELRTKHSAHAVEFWRRPARRDIPIIKAVRCHGQKRGRGRVHQPVANGLLARLSGLVSMLARCEHLAFEFEGEMRSEEHTSELQSLMRISYAVFCLKKKKKNVINI